MTIGQSLLGALLLANMRFSWWEAAALFTLFFIQFVLSGFEKPLDPGIEFNAMAARIGNLFSVSAQQVETFAYRGKEATTAIYFLWSVLILAFGFKGNGFKAIKVFPRLIREHW
jgi:hypothetical protein